MYLFLILFFACFGSFSACYMYRFIHKEDILLERSHCPHCKQTLAWWQLIPIFSFVFLHGKCYYCKQKISWYYPILELMHVFLCVVLSLFINNYLTILVVGIYISINYMLAYIDYKTQLVPTSLLICLLLLALCMQPIHLTNALFYLITLSILSVIKKNQLGFGDVLYISIQSLLLPISYTSLAICFACILAILYFIKKRNSHLQIPFLPFLVISFLFVLIIS